MGYDLVLLLDVLEHFDKEEGRFLLDDLLSKNTGILISTPKHPSAQKDAFGNIYETHDLRGLSKSYHKWQTSFLFLIISPTFAI